MEIDMCHCKNIEVGTYKNQVELPIPPVMEGYRQYRKREGFPETICVDTCLSEEIQELWKQGIKTTGCCCGHNYLSPYIGVDEDYKNRMSELGYVVQLNENDYTRTDSFIPKSI